MLVRHLYDHLYYYLLIVYCLYNHLPFVYWIDDYLPLLLYLSEYLLHSYWTVRDLFLPLYHHRNQKMN